MARPIVRAASGIILAKRVQLDALVIPDATSVNYDTPLVLNLLECTEAQDEEAESDGSGVADCPLYSRIVGLKLNLLARHTTSCLMRWMLVKRPDGEAIDATTSLAGVFHNSNDTEDMRELRKYTLAKGLLSVSPDRLEKRLPIFVKRKALARVSPMRENDVLSLIIAKDTSGAAATLDGFGTIYVRANA